MKQNCLLIHWLLAVLGCSGLLAAEQREPVKRRVALKILKLGMDTKQVVARFETERQAPLPLN